MVVALVLSLYMLIMYRCIYINYEYIQISHFLKTILIKLTIYQVLYDSKTTNNKTDQSCVHRIYILDKK